MLNIFNGMIIHTHYVEVVEYSIEYGYIWASMSNNIHKEYWYHYYMEYTCIGFDKHYMFFCEKVRCVGCIYNMKDFYYKVKINKLFEELV